MPCQKAVINGKEVEILKAWELKPKKGKGIKVGIALIDGKKVNVKLPDDYPVPCP